jgi:Lar family restriction alleviation protein
MEPKPCPFCGGSGIYMDGPMIIDEVEYFFMCCKSCGAEGPGNKIQAMARREWNRRSL